jgi:hypothetical protein
MKTFFVSILFCGMAVSGGLAQPGGGPADSLEVRIFPPSGGEVFHAPATIRISAYVAQSAPARAGDVVRVEFFADTNSLGFGTSTWHDAVRPQPQPGRPVPMFVIAPGFSPAEFVWSNAPAGNHALTARADGTNSLWAVSAAVNVTVLP